MEKKTLWQKIYPWLGFKSYYEDDGEMKYKTYYWVSKKLWLFREVVGRISE